MNPNPLQASDVSNHILFCKRSISFAVRQVVSSPHQFCSSFVRMLFAAMASPVPPDDKEALPAPSAADSVVGVSEHLADQPVDLDESPDTSPGAASRAARSPVQENTGSPNKMRRLAQKKILLPIQFYLERLPDSEYVNMTSLLAWHAGDMVRKNGWQDNPKRRRTKTGLSLEDYCISLSKNPLCSIAMPVVSGKDRVYASHIAAKVFSTAFDWSVRRGRECVSGLWPSTPSDVKNKWWFLSTYELYNDQWSEGGSSEAQPPASTPIECYGAMFTSQTAIGRSSVARSTLL